MQEDPEVERFFVFHSVPGWASVSITLSSEEAHRAIGVYRRNGGEARCFVYRGAFGGPLNFEEEVG